MKKILFLILFIFNSFVYSVNFVYDNYGNRFNVVKISELPECGGGSSYNMFEEKTSFNSLDYSTHTYNLENFDSVTKFYARDYSYSYLYYQFNLEYSSTSSKYVGSIRKFKCIPATDTTGSYCPYGFSVGNECYTFPVMCSSNQVFDDRSLVGSNTCVNVCPENDIFTGSSSSLYFSAGMMDMVTNTHMFCDSPKWDKETCEQHAIGGFKWVEKNGSFFSSLSGLLDGVGLFADSRCVDTKLHTTVLFGMGTTSTALNPRSSFIKNSVDKELIDTYIIERLAAPKNATEESLVKSLLEWFTKEENVNTLPKNTKNNPNPNQDYNFADMVIETSPSTGQSVLVPKFTVSPSTNQGITISNSEFLANINRSGLNQNAVNSSLPPSSFSYTPEILQGAVQTVTKTPFEIPTTTTVGEMITIKAPATNSLSGVTSTIRDYPAVVSQIGGGTRVINTIPIVSDSGTTKYTISETIKSDNSISTDVTITSTLPDSSGRNFTFSNGYNYTTSGGSLISSNNLPSTITSPDGTVYTIPPGSTTPTNYNYNNPQQNLDELINIEAKPVPTGFDGLVSQEQILDNDVFSFLGELKDNFTNVYTDFQNIFSSLQDKPVVVEKTGSCSVSLNMFGQTYTNDLCTVIRPAKPFISVFLTFFGTITVLMYAFKTKD